MMNSSATKLSLLYILLKITLNISKNVLLQNYINDENFFLKIIYNNCFKIFFSITCLVI